MERLIKVPSLLFYTLIICMTVVPICSGTLSVGFYSTTCPNAEAIVKGAVTEALQNNSGLGAGLIRMAFHDCFVQGCDGSILLNSTSGNMAEKDNPANNPSLRGFEVIDEAKHRLEATPGCAGVVSCADIVQFAARDSAYILGSINYAVPSGRRDGLTSNTANVFSNLPAPFHNVTTVLALFAAKNLTANDTVILSGAHSIGRSHCSSFKSRLNPADPTMNVTLANSLRAKCNSSGDPTVDQDLVTPNVLDIQYYIDVQQHNVLFTSDQTLLDNTETRTYVNANAKKPKSWMLNFAAAMVKMSQIGVITGSDGQIRIKCSVVN